MKKTVITIGRQYGSGGRIIAQKLAERLGIPYYDKEIIQSVAKETGLSESYIKEIDQKPTNSFLYDLVFATQGPTIPDQVYIAQSKVIRRVAEEGPCVIVGRCADYILRDDPRRLSVFVHAPLDERVRRAREEYGVQEPNLESFVLRQDKARASYYNYFATGKWGQSREYDLCVSSHMGIAAAVATIKAAALAVAGGTGA